ncbi:hypothetical protein DFJ58DRAFT_790370 [Suillus subalutaceus]|uniref:uncharacterized protein n=1 Tax=Suillus subalutaceus TaxID=48586 RepID=UPI001B85C98B|nr:uncharacterized protein DFJ58DRAFT_790370 [Suillus subalutaceus]KAG1852872.1 hypothetical protein DFJ58DRAFT_790370 [Suillus subalutaceus]
MKFISLTTMIMSAAVLAGIVTAQKEPTGLPCSPRVLAVQFACGTLPLFNGGLPYLYFCEANSTITVIQTCNCASCCNLVNGGQGPGSSCTGT